MDIETYSTGAFLETVYIMASDSLRPSFKPFQTEAELELLQLILNQRELPYPWSPSNAASTQYFEALEQELAEDGWDEEIFAPYVQNLAVQLDNAWTTLQPQVAPNRISTALFERFAAQVPQALLDAIAQRAHEVAAQQRSLSEQLVSCVQSVLTGWNEDDLVVLARPFAYAMRSGNDAQSLEGALKSVRCAEWSELSEIEQVRLSLVVARYALAQASAEDAE
ncbi:hypothetical protein ACQ4M4_03750 [Leptolyngbya sp. AN02str]|uniref:hypothetical protein n=1 Tax=Leptolyngbya sp. AN02str TaxID=3423363 RepID=UPI003D321D3D